MCNTVYIDKSHMCNVKWKKPNTERIYTVYTLYDLLKFKHSENLPLILKIRREAAFEGVVTRSEDMGDVLGTSNTYILISVWVLFSYICSICDHSLSCTLWLVYCCVILQ